ncbi:MAG: BatA domain-containing protein [Planctomycetaceae bacterium]
MSFLSGIFLLALPLAAVPVVLHLYRRRQRTVIPWGAMQFLTEATKQGRRRERWEEIVLMLLRAAAVLVLVLALSRPQLSGRWFGEQATREVILVLDDSMSMSREINEESPFAELVRKAEGILDELTPDDAVQVMTAVGGPRWLTPQALRTDGLAKQRLVSQIKTLQPTDGAADLYACVQAALAVDSAADVQARHVVVLSDGQAHGWRIDALSAWRRARDMIDAGTLPTTLQMISCGFAEEPIDNLAVTAVEASHTHVGVGDAVSVRVEVQNAGAAPGPATSLQTLVNGAPAEVLPIASLRTGESTSVQWKWPATAPGVYALGCRLQSDDQLSRDNTDAVIVEVVGEIPVLVVEPPAGYRQRISDSAFLTAALGYDGATPQGAWHSVFAPHLISVDELETTSLSAYRAIVMTDLPPLKSDSIERLREFVERGGGLWAALGRRTDREAFNAVWYDDGGGLSPLALDEVVTYVAQKQGDGEGANAEQREAVIHPPSADRPLTAQLADTNRLDIDTVRIKARHRFQPPARGQELSVTMETGDGEPLIIENYLGRGRIIIQAIPFDVGWSNLPLTKAYVVMVQDWLEYLTQPAGTQFNLPAGGRIELTRPASAGADRAIIKLPDETERPLALRAEGDAAVYRYSQTQVPGRYEIHAGDAGGETAAVPFQIARDARESDLAPLTGEQRAALTGASGLQFPVEFKNLIPPVTGGRREQPIWNSLLVALLVLLGVELFLSTRAARRRTPGSSLSASLEQDGDLYSPAWTQSLRGVGRT